MTTTEDPTRAAGAHHVQIFDRDGFVVLDDLLSQDEVGAYRAIYDRFLSGEIDAAHLRSDLGQGSEATRTGVENITQIMWPRRSSRRSTTCPCTRVLSPWRAR